MLIERCYFCFHVLHEIAIDCAQNMNGYVYHTKYDNFDLINLGSLQHTGENVISVMHELDGTQEIQNSTVCDLNFEVKKHCRKFYKISGIS